MLHRILLHKKWGGALFISLLFVSALFAHDIPQSILLNCGRLSLEIVPKAYTGSTSSTACSECCPGSISCERIEYQVFLKASSGSPIPGGGDFFLEYSELYIALKLDRSSDAVVSQINGPQTESCLASFLSGFSDDYQADSIEDEVTLRLSEGTGGEPLPEIEFDNYSSIEPLFSIIVDGFPGETFGIALIEFTYSSNQNGCNGSSSGGTPAGFPMPNSTNTDLTLFLDDINCNAEDYIDLPIMVNSSLTGTINLFDFAIVVSTTAVDGFYSEPIVLDTLADTNPKIRVMDNPNGGGHIVNFSYTAQPTTPLSGTNVQLCILRISRPPNLCQEYTTTATLVPGRIRVTPALIGSISCKAIQVGDTEEECVVDEVAICSDFQLNVTTEPNTNSCTELQAIAKLSWTMFDSPLEFESLRARIDFELQSGITITGVSTSGFDCPSSGNLCPGPCLDYSGHSISLCIEAISFSISNDAEIIIDFNAPVGCIERAVVRKFTLKIKDSPPACQPDINPPSGFPVCSADDHYISGQIATEAGCWVEGVEMTIIAHPEDEDCDDVFTIGDALHAPCQAYRSGCLCSEYDYKVTPFLDENPLNGVTTYDLVLISKHILGIQLLGSPYKLIAAEADTSKNVTTSDIVELRKLILGIYQNLPLKPSWVFLVKDYSFPDPLNPWYSNPIGYVKLQNYLDITTLPDSIVDFIAIKVGDVNNTAIANTCDTSIDCTAFQRPAGIFDLTTTARRTASAKAGQVVTFPLRAHSDIPLTAWQGALRFDPDMLELIGPSYGDLPGLSAESFNLAEADKGLIRALWFAPLDEAEVFALKRGTTLFNLTFRLKKDLIAGANPFWLEQGYTPNLGWTADGATYQLQMPQDAPAKPLLTEREEPENPVVRCMPNPSPGAITFDISGFPKVKRAQLNILDAFGRRLWSHHPGDGSAPVQIQAPEAATWPAGVYHWELRLDKKRHTGTFVRQ